MSPEIAGAPSVDLVGEQEPEPPGQRPLKPLKTSTVVAAVIASLALGAVAVVILLEIAGNDRGLRVDAIKTGLSIGAGSGGVFALLLAVQRFQLAQRKQIEDERSALIARQHARRVAQTSESDALERRITDLYIRAVDQLGSTRAVVQLGGLYALERPAQDNPLHRQTIVNVMCAYLQMTLGGDGDAGGSSVKADIQEGVKPVWESRITIATQQILARHVRWPDHPTVPAPATYWPRLIIDLSDAILVNLDFSQCAFYALDLQRAVCKGPTQFLYASFERDALFEGATFFGNVSFRRASFLHRARFSGGKFHAGVSFRQARFDSGPEFGDAATFGDHPDRTWPTGWREILPSEQAPTGSRSIQQVESAAPLESHEQQAGIKARVYLCQM
jgi:hypothetical protein